MSATVLAAVALTGAIAAAVTRTTKAPLATGLIHQDFPADFRDPRNLAGAVDNVFIGRVVGHVSDVRLGRTPETQFQVDIEETLKGSVPDTVVVNQQGGYDARSKAMILVEGDQLLVPGRTYVFATRTHPNGTWQTVVSGYGDVLIATPAALAVERARFIDAVAHEVPLR